MALLLLVLAIVIVIGGYRIYAIKMDREVMQTDAKRSTPATMYNDGVDFMPASASVLFGYQFKSIAALGPIVGPITAAQFGWLPAFLWLVVGVVFIGWVQDYGSALLSMRNEGMTMGGLSYKLISPRARTLLLSFLYIYLLLIMGAFGAIVAPLLGTAFVPIGFLILVVAGVLAGQMTYRWKVNLVYTTVITVAIALFGIWLGQTDFFAGDPDGLITKFNAGFGTYNTPYGTSNVSTVFWAVIMLIFCYLGSVLPIWRFAQPVNYTSFWFVGISLVLAMLGIVLATIGGGSTETTFNLPAFNTWNLKWLGPIWPMLFVTISCGAVSGWHSLVSTSGTARQLEKETDTLPVGGGAMFTEAVLAVMSVIFAATAAAGVYDSGNSYFLTKGAGGVFAGGMASFMHTVGVPESLGAAVGSIFLVVMAVTVMQLVLRFMRVASAELLGDRIPALKNPHVGSIIAVGLTLFLVVFGFWQWIWVLFGGSNQLFAGMALLLLAIWLAEQSRSYNWAFIPGMFMYVTTVAALLFTAWTALDKGFLRPDEIYAGKENLLPYQIGNLVSIVFALYMAVSALILLYDGLQAFSRARSGMAAAAAGD
jgi:carbon starvation protein